jgi:hypothetical protein
MVEGASPSPLLRRHSHDRVSQIIKISRQIIHGNPHNFNPVRLEPGVALLIALRPVAHVMTYAVELNRQPRGGAIEIEDVRADWMLPAKDRLTWFTSSQSAPQPNLRR